MQRSIRIESAFRNHRVTGNAIAGPGDGLSGRTVSFLWLVIPAEAGIALRYRNQSDSRLSGNVEQKCNGLASSQSGQVWALPCATSTLPCLLWQSDAVVRMIRDFVV